MERFRKNYSMMLAISFLLQVALFFCSSAFAAHSAEFDATMRLAVHGNVPALNRLGDMYSKGQEGVDRNYAQAIFYYRKAAELGNSEGQYNLGVMYHQGKGVSQDFTQAVKWYSKAADQGHKIAQTGLGEIRNYIASLQSAAEESKVDALVALGDLYVNGNGVPRDDAKAVDLYRNAAKQGDPKAQCRLGDMHAEGRGVIQDFTQAVTLYREAIAQDYPEAKYKLGAMYHRGRGVPKDNIYAYAWNSLAADQGYKKAIGNEKFAASLLTAQEMEQARELAIRLRSESNSRKR